MSTELPKTGQEAVASSELLACRYCNRTPRMLQSSLMGITCYWVECTQCAEEGPAYYNRRQAVGAWNAYQRRQANEQAH